MAWRILPTVIIMITMSACCVWHPVRVVSGFRPASVVAFTTTTTTTTTRTKHKKNHYYHPFSLGTPSHRGKVEDAAAAFSSSTVVGRRSREAESIRLFSSSSGGGSSTTATTTDSNSEVEQEQQQQLRDAITAKGDEIRALKATGADKAAVAPLVEELLALKARLPGEHEQEQDKNSKKQQKSKKKQKQQQQQSDDNDDDDDDNFDDENNINYDSDFITARTENYSRWYNDVIRVTGLAETSPVRGCMVIKPTGMALWERVRDVLDAKIKRHGAENAYFPLLIPKSFLSKEAEHVDGFAKECAVVTHHRLKSAATGTDGNRDSDSDGSSSAADLVVDPDAALEDPLIIRPTSETMIWYMFRKWIASHRDLPLKINQWANVMRWEMRTRPFLRTSEFLWQEGHTAHATAESAVADAAAMIRNYADLCRDLLAIPVVVGTKSPSERFAGAAETYTVEAVMPNGWALQSGTSHFLGQSFGKAFDVTYQDETGQQQHVWGASWGVSTRLLGALIMTHSDDGGLVLPPAVAPVQAVVCTIPVKKSDAAGQAAMTAALNALVTDLETAGLRVKVDDRDHVRTGAKFYEWERKGVPLRIELGPRDVKNAVCVFKYRAGGASADKSTVELSEAAATAAAGLQTMQTDLYQAAADRLQNSITEHATYEDMKAALQNDEASQYPGAGLFLVPWKCDANNEEQIKQECKATIRCYPLQDNEEKRYAGKKCFYSGDDATHMALFGRAF